jgi:hypothetical protein
MSKQRQITKVEVSVNANGGVWVTVFWDGKPKSNRCNNRFHQLYGGQPLFRRTSLLRRARLMQDIIVNQWAERE